MIPKPRVMIARSSVLRIAKRLNFSAIAEILEMKGYDDPDGTLILLRSLGEYVKELGAAEHEQNKVSNKGDLK